MVSLMLHPRFSILMSVDRIHSELASLTVSYSQVLLRQVKFLQVTVVFLA
jgi:hypothetical protein